MCAHAHTYSSRVHKSLTGELSLRVIGDPGDNIRSTIRLVLFRFKFSSTFSDMSCMIDMVFDDCLPSGSMSSDSPYTDPPN